MSTASSPIIAKVVVAAAVAAAVAKASGGAIADAAPQGTNTATDTPPRSTSERGLVGEIILTDAPNGLRAKPDQPLGAPVLVRVSEVLRGGRIAYRVEYIGTVAGDYDLRPLLELADGSPATSLAPLPVRVVSQLPDNHGSDLFSVPAPPFRLESHYRTIFAVLAAAWASVPIVVLVRRRLRRVPPPIVISQPPPLTLADLLRPLVEAAMKDGLSIREQGRLELLLLHVWRDRLGLDGTPLPAAMAAMRRHPEAGALLGAVERWLHARGAGGARPNEDIGALLAPYATIPAPDPSLEAPSTPAPGDQNSRQPHQPAGAST